eukprot:Skav227144  [mRNA]  locus=scaffold133:566927:570148:+ [translate_table: standard]
MSSSPVSGPCPAKLLCRMALMRYFTPSCAHLSGICGAGSEITDGAAWAPDDLDLFPAKSAMDLRRCLVPTPIELTTTTRINADAKIFQLAKCLMLGVACCGPSSVRRTTSRRDSSRSCPCHMSHWINL